MSKDTIDYFLVKYPKFWRIYLLPKIHKQLLHDVPGRPVISNWGCYTENIFAFLDNHLQPLAQKVKSYIMDTNHFLNILKSSRKLPQFPSARLMTDLFAKPTDTHQLLDPRSSHPYQFKAQ